MRTAEGLREDIRYAVKAAKAAEKLHMHAAAAQFRRDIEAAMQKLDRMGEHFEK